MSNNVPPGIRKQITPVRNSGTEIRERTRPEIDRISGWKHLFLPI